MDIELNVDKKVFYKRIHRLVAQEFIPNPYNKPAVNHIDGNKLNNNVDNLEWVTNSENMIHATVTGLQPTTHRNCKHEIYNEATSIILDTMKQVYEETGLTRDKAIYCKRNNKQIPYGKYKGFYLKTIY